MTAAAPALIAARSRYAEDQLGAAIARGATQYVILGAGLDTYAYGSAHDRLRVFEVDYPAAQILKTTRLQTAAIAVRSSLVFVPANFAEQPLCSDLASCGFERDQITFFSWFGGTAYVTAASAIATLGFIASLPPGSGLVFDYAIERFSTDSREQLALDGLASRTATTGNELRWVMDARALERLLKAAGFHEIEDLGPAEIDARYFGQRTDGLSVAAGVAHLVSARI